MVTLFLKAVWLIKTLFVLFWQPIVNVGSALMDRKRRSRAFGFMMWGLSIMTALPPGSKDPHSNTISFVLMSVGSWLVGEGRLLPSWGYSLLATGVILGCYCEQVQGLSPTAIRAIAVGLLFVGGQLLVYKKRDNVEADASGKEGKHA